MSGVELREINMCKECPYKRRVYFEGEILYGDNEAFAPTDGYVSCTHYHSCLEFFRKSRDTLMGCIPAKD